MRPGERARIALAAVILVACQRELAPPAPNRDGSLPDAGSFDAGPIRRRDGGPRLDAGPRDASADAPMDAGVDAGPPPIVVDGVIGEAEWAGVPVSTSGVAATGSFAGSALTSLRAVRDRARLYVAIEGIIGSGQAIVMYVDHDVGGAGGVVSPTPFDDFLGSLDAALSKTLFTPADVRIDLAWGTLDMGRASIPLDERMGWRDVATSPDAFRRIEGPPSACTARACETSISLLELGAAPGTEIGLFVRLVSASSLAMSNQTLPMDEPAAPEVIGTFLSL